MVIVTRSFPSLHFQEPPEPPTRNGNLKTIRLVNPGSLPFFSVIGLDPTRPYIQP